MEPLETPKPDVILTEPPTPEVVIFDKNEL
jgi:hypothetical protein